MCLSCRGAAPPALCGAAGSQRSRLSLSPSLSLRPSLCCSSAPRPLSVVSTGICSPAPQGNERLHLGLRHTLFHLANTFQPEPSFSVASTSTPNLSLAPGGGTRGIRCDFGSSAVRLWAWAVAGVYTRIKPLISSAEPHFLCKQLPQARRSCEGKISKADFKIEMLRFY